MVMMNITDEKKEECSKSFSLKVADKLEKKEINLTRMNELMVDFFNLLNSAKEEKEIETFIDEI